MIHRFKQFIGLTLCAALVWTCGDCAEAALGLNQTPVVHLESNHFYFTEQALVQRLIFPSRVNPAISQGRFFRSLVKTSLIQKKAMELDRASQTLCVLLFSHEDPQGRILEQEGSVPSILPDLLSASIEATGWNPAMRESQYLLEVSPIRERPAQYVRTVEKARPKLAGAIRLDTQMIEDAEKDVSGARTAAYLVLSEERLHAKMELEAPESLPSEEQEFLIHQDILKLFLKIEPQEREAVIAYWTDHAVYDPAEYAYAEHVLRPAHERGLEAAEAPLRSYIEQLQSPESPALAEKPSGGPLVAWKLNLSPRAKRAFKIAFVAGAILIGGFLAYHIPGVHDTVANLHWGGHAQHAVEAVKSNPHLPSGEAFNFDFHKYHFSTGNVLDTLRNEVVGHANDKSKFFPSFSPDGSGIVLEIKGHLPTVLDHGKRIVDFPKISEQLTSVVQVMHIPQGSGGGLTSAYSTNHVIKPSDLYAFNAHLRNLTGSPDTEGVRHIFVEFFDSTRTDLFVAAPPVTSAADVVNLAGNVATNVSVSLPAAVENPATATHFYNNIPTAAIMMLAFASGVLSLWGLSTVFKRWSLSQIRIAVFSRVRALVMPIAAVIGFVLLAVVSQFRPNEKKGTQSTLPPDDWTKTPEPPPLPKPRAHTKTHHATPVQHPKVVLPQGAPFIPSVSSEEFLPEPAPIEPKAMTPVVTAHLLEPIAPEYTINRPVVTLTWTQLRDAIVEADMIEAESQNAAADTAAEVAKKEGHPLFNVTPGFTFESSNIYGMFPTVSKSFNLNRDPLHSLADPLDKINSSLVKEKRLLALQDRLEKLEEAHKAYLQAKKWQKIIEDEAAASVPEEEPEYVQVDRARALGIARADIQGVREKVEALVLPILTPEVLQRIHAEEPSVPAEAQLEIPAEAEGHEALIFDAGSAVDAEGHIASLLLAQSLRQLEGDARIHFMSLVRKLLPSFNVAITPVAGSLGSMLSGAPQFHKYPNAYINPADRAQAAALDFLAAMQASQERFAKKLPMERVQEAYSLAFETDAMPSLNALEVYLKEKELVHPGHAFIGLLDGTLEAMYTLPGHYALASTKPNLPIQYPNEPNPGSTAALRGNAMNPNFSIINRKSSQSPAALTIEDRTGTYSHPVAVLNGLLNGSRLHARKVAWLTAAKEGIEAEKNNDMKGSLKAQYRAAILAAQLDPSARNEFSETLSRQDSAHFKYYVLGFTPGQSTMNRGFGKLYRLMKFHPHAPANWTPGMQIVVLHAQLMARASGDISLFDVLEALTPRELQSSLKAQWNAPLAEEPDDLIMAKQNLALEEANAPSWKSYFQILPTLVVTWTRPGVMNHGETATGAANINSYVKAKVDHQMKVGMAKAAVQMLEKKAVQDKAVKDAERTRLEFLLADYTTMDNELMKDGIQRNLTSHLYIEELKRDLLNEAKEKNLTLGAAPVGMEQSFIDAKDRLAVAHAVADAEVPPPSPAPKLTVRKFLVGVLKKGALQDTAVNEFDQIGGHGGGATFNSYPISFSGLKKARADAKTAADGEAARQAEIAKRQVFDDVIHLFDKSAAAQAELKEAKLLVQVAHGVVRQAHSLSHHRASSFDPALRADFVAEQLYRAAQQKADIADYVLRTRIEEVSKNAKLTTFETREETIPSLTLGNPQADAHRAFPDLGNFFFTPFMNLFPRSPKNPRFVHPHLVYASA